MAKACVQQRVFGCVLPLSMQRNAMGGSQLCHKAVRRRHGMLDQARYLSTPVPVNQEPLLTELRSRGLVTDFTDEDELEKALDNPSQPITLYCGFDPTAKSLHIGNLVALITLLRFMLRGHQSLFIVGGATGRIGDPSGRSTERNLLDQTALDENLAGITRSIVQVCRNTAEVLGIEDRDEFVSRADIVDNFDFYKNLNPIEFLAEVGPHFRVASMMSKTSVKNRMESEVGLSFLEFSYQILQAYDFLKLLQTQNCTLQIGGSDQWGNITAGCELIRKTVGKTVHGLTLPLVTTASGVKFGKSAGNAIWLDSSMCTSYDMYQFFLNTDDLDVRRYLTMFTFLELTEIEQIVKQHDKHPESRFGQKRLAQEVTKLVHGYDGLTQAEKISEGLFGQTPLTELSAAELHAMLESTPSVTVPKPLVLEDTLLSLAVQVGLYPSRKAAKRALQGGGFYVNDAVCKEDAVVDPKDLLHGQFTILRKGKKNNAIIHWV